MGLLSTRARSAETADSAHAGEEAEPTLRERARALLVAAFAPIVTTYAAVAALFALISTVAEHARFSAVGTLLAAGPGTLAVYQVPVEIGGASLGVLPLLPTLGACALVARTACGTAQRLGYHEPGQAGGIVGVIAGAHALVGVSIALLSSGAPLEAGPLAAALIPGVLAGASALVGLSGRCGVTTAVRRYFNPVAMSGLRAGALALAGLLAAGCVVFAVGWLFSLHTAHGLFTNGAPGFGGSFGMLLLSLVYLPNAVVAGAGVATGPGFSMGALSVSPFGFTPGAVPGVPLLAGVPESYAEWWPLLLVLPLTCGLLVGFALRDVAEQALVRLRAVLIAGAFTAFGVVLLATLAGGKLGSGAVSPVEIPAGMFSLAAFGWIVVPAGIVAWFAGPHPAMRLPALLMRPCAPTEPTEWAEQSTAQESSVPDEEEPETEDSSDDRDDDDHAHDQDPAGADHDGQDAEDPDLEESDREESDPVESDPEYAVDEGPEESEEEGPVVEDRGQDSAEESAAEKSAAEESAAEKSAAEESGAEGRGDELRDDDDSAVDDTAPTGDAGGTGEPGERASQ